MSKKRLCSHSGKDIKIIIRSKKAPSISPNLHPMTFILATLTPVMEEHKKLIYHLSEPSS